jgi:manganese transport protein
MQLSMPWLSRLKSLGPGLLVTAAFIGPGTVATASRAGASFGLSLLWALLFSVIATIVLQEMSARLGIVSRQGLGEAVRSTFRRRLPRAAACLLIVAAIGFGNAAYQTGNITGAAIGLEVLTGVSVQVWAMVLGLVTFVLLSLGAYRPIERVLVALVIVMSLLFVATACLVRPALGDVVHGTFIPSLPPDSLTTVVALVGTTVVPYNLFLHASSVRAKWADSVPREEALRASRIDTVLAISLGGLVTLSIVATASAAFFPKGTFRSAADMAMQLEPLLGGPAAKVCFALGLFAAGVTSSITAPLAAAYAVCGCMGWRAEFRSWPFRAVWFVVLVLGTLVAASGYKSPQQTILIAQIANGLLLPLIAVFLLVAVNRRDLMGGHRNSLLANLAALLVVLTVTALGLNTILTQLGAADWLYGA